MDLQTLPFWGYYYRSNQSDYFSPTVPFLYGAFAKMNRTTYQSLRHMTVPWFVAIAIAATTIVTPAIAGEGASSARPKYSVTNRQNEDWSGAAS
jgi:hypothetical protein